MASASLRSDERVGLAVAVVLHALLVAVLVLQPGKAESPPLPDRMTVSLTTDVSLASTALDPAAESRASIAPTLSDEPEVTPPVEQAQPEPMPAPRPVATTPPPRPAPAKAAPQPRAKATPQLRAKATPEPPRRRPDRPAAKPAAKSAGGSRIGADFLPGTGASTNTSETRLPASQIGASAKASLAQAIARQLRPHWSAPQGADAEKLVTVLSFELNPDGTLAGRPRVVSQSGVTDSNAPQKDLHAERAIRAVQLAAPFDLPPEYYEVWKRVTSFRFDRNFN